MGVDTRAVAPQVTRRLAPWPRPTARSRAWTPRYALGAYVCALLLAVLLSLLLTLLGVGLPAAGGTLLIELCFLATLMPLWRRGLLRPRDLGLRRAAGARSTGLVLLAAFGYGLIALAWTRALNLPRSAGSPLTIGHQGTAVVVVTGFALCVGAPVAEEIFFRGFLYRSLRNRMSILPSALASSLLFGLLHTQYPLAERPILVFFGVTMCLLYERTGSLLPGIAMHSFIDASAFENLLDGRTTVVTAAFMLLAALLLAAPLLRGAWRLLTRKPVFRDHPPAQEEPPPAAARSGAAATAPHNPFALEPPRRRRPGERTKTAIVAGCVVLIVLLLLSAGSGTGSAPAPSAAGATGAPEQGCPDGSSYALATDGAGEVLELRRALLAVTGRVAGRTYQSGVAEPGDMWSDDGPRRLVDTRLPGGVWPAGYEIRRYQPGVGDFVADALRFPSPASARRFLASASGTRCHTRGSSRALRSPAGARELLWVNPDGYPQQDIFLARGEVVYRLVDVNQPAPGAVDPGYRARAVRAIRVLACALPRSGCGG